MVSFIYSPLVRERFADVDLIIGCGDLPAVYLEYVVTLLNVPMVYVPGNHDPDDYRAEGGEDLDGRMTKVGGFSFLGLGGSPRYKPRGRHQHTELQMALRVYRWLPRLTLRRLLRGRGFDVLVTHAPPRGVHDGQDQAHLGFKAFHTLLRVARPTLMLHGHHHVLRNLVPTESQVEDTRVINVFPYRVIELPEPS